MHQTLLDVFVEHLANPDVKERHAVECGDESWTYEDLDIISTGLALEIEAAYGARPTVAIIAENLPYTFALILAVWKLRGIVAPIDYHTPENLLQPMLKKISPSCVAVPSTEKRTQQVVLDLGLPLHNIHSKNTTMTALCQQFIQSSNIPFPTLPDSTSVAVYLFTSSATDVANIKAVPLTHRSLFSPSQTTDTWLKRAYPSVQFSHVRHLGWSPFSHMIAIALDIIDNIRSGGCYIFGLLPSSYFIRGTVDSGPRDIFALLMDAMVKHRPEYFGGVPWVLEGLIKYLDSGIHPEQREEFVGALQRLKIFQLGGAPTSIECIRWAREHQIPLTIAIGMTELGGTLFSKVADEVDGWNIEDCGIADAELVLLGEDGKPSDSEGELVISSKLIAHGYLDHDNSDFTVASDGRVTFQTGDLYSKSPQGRFSWLGRKTDFIQLVSGETVDPRVLEKSLNMCTSIAQSCIFGNNFLRGSAQFLCALIELNDNHDSTNMDISRAVRGINRALPPPLRISWSHVIVLEEGRHIPLTGKRLIFRKKLEALFGDHVASMLNSSRSDSSDEERQNLPTQNHIRENEVRDIVLDIAADVLRISRETLESDSDSTFSELGMDSTAATSIVNKINLRLDMNLPRNACHTHADLGALTTAILEMLRLVETEQPVVFGLVSHVGDHLADDIVIVGQALRLPGGSLDLDTPESFWEALVTMREDLLVSPKRWDHASFRRPSGAPPAPGDITFDKAGFIKIESFDNSFFGISSAEAMFISPATRLALETTFQALENANIPISRLKGTDTGIFVAGMDVCYEQLLFASQGFDCHSRFFGTGVASSASCGRLSYLLDVHGPSISLDTACSGGMVALDQAFTYLRSGKAETAIVCGVNTHTWPGSFAFISAQQMCSPTSRCSTFADNADGYVPSEGVVSLILKTRTAALRDKDNILATIKSAGTRHNGKSQGLVAPSPLAQAALQRSLLSAAAMKPSDIDFIEAHGTGTTLGDQIEIEAINSVFRSSHTSTRPLIIGAAKACIGHTEVAAGLVGIVKAIKQLSEGKVAGLNSLNNGRLNPEIDTSSVPLHIPSKLTDFPQRDGPPSPRRALVVAYGFAGTISGCTLETPTVEKSETREIEGGSTWMIFSLSAKSRNALLKYLQIYLDFCLDAPPEAFRSICYTSCIGRELYRHRFTCVVKDLDNLVQRLKDQILHGYFSASFPSNSRLVFAFPGQGSQFYGMAKTLATTFPKGRPLIFPSKSATPPAQPHSHDHPGGVDFDGDFSGRPLTFPVFREILTDAANTATSEAGFDVLSYLVGSDQEVDSDTINKSAVSQICIYVYQYSVCQFLRRIGVPPDAVLGNSLGEISAAVEAGVLSYKLGLQFVVARAEILSPDPECPAGMAAIAASEPTILQSIQSLHLSARVVIAIFSGINNHVVSGDLNAINVLVAHVKKIGIRATLLNVDQGFHSPCIARALPRLQEWIENRAQYFRPLNLPLFSTALGKQLARHESLHPHYWVDHARDPVRLQQAVEATNKSFKNTCILDVGPTPTVWSALQNNNLPDTLMIASSTKKGKDQELAFLTAVACLIENGRNPNFHVLFGTQIPKTAIPTYPFQRQRHYPDFIPSRYGLDIPAAKNPRDGRFVVDLDLYELLEDHQIYGKRVLPGAGMVDYFARRQENKAMNIRFHRQMVVHAPGRSCQVEFGDATFNMNDGSSTVADQLCSGSFVKKENTPVRICPATVGSEARSKSVDEVYSHFTSVHFGPSFKSIASIKFWDTHADGLIVVPPSLIPDHDRIRALDACLHMFGACNFEPKDRRSSGSFLPVALEGFCMYADALPSSFVCRYRLPFVTERRNQLAWTAFEVLSLSGKVLASCAKYSAAFVHFGNSENPPPLVEGCSFQQEWIPRELGSTPSSTIEVQPQPEIAFLGRPDAIKLASRFVEGILVEFPTNDLGWRYKKFQPAADILPGWCYLPLSSLLEVLNVGRNTTIVLDATYANDAPDSASFSSFLHQVLVLMKALAACTNRTFEFVVVSTASGSLEQASTGFPTVGALIQGMLRVFRNELGLERAWSLQFPCDTLPNQISEILNNELAARRNGAKDIVVSYRHSSPAEESQDGRLVRLVPELHRIHREASLSPLSGVTVIVGMGSIGLALASQAIVAGSSTVVFLGRRAPTDTRVAKQLSAFSTIPGRVMYLQADVCDLAAVRRVLQEITAAHGTIRCIVHTAAVVADATIASVTKDSFDRVIRPKVLGAYNLHVLSEELDLKLDAFVLFSSISVPLGNPGQVAYVAANAFLDALAVHRRSIGLPGVSMQLGPWESELADNLPPSSSNLLSTISHETGLPLIINALSSPVPIQVIADLNTHALSRNPVLADDPLFAVLLADVATPRRAPNRSVDAVSAVIGILRAELEWLDSDPLDLDESLTASGIDSIAFNHIRGRVLEELGVDVPMVFLSDAFSLSSMIKHVQEMASREEA